MGIEPTLAAWEAAVLPLNYTRGRSSLCPPRVAWQRFARTLSCASRTQKLLPRVRNQLKSEPPFWLKVIMLPVSMSSPKTFARVPYLKVT